MKSLVRCTLLGTCLLPALAVAEDSPVVIDTTSEALLVEACSYLRSATRFGVDVDVMYEEVLLDGTTVTYHRNDSILLERPDKLRVDVIDDQGTRSVFVNADKAVIYRPLNDVYAEVETSGTLDERMQKLEANGVTLPLGDLLQSRPCSDLVEHMQRVTFAGTHYVSGLMANHLLIETDHVDMQMWIADDPAPVIVQLVIQYRELAGQPRYSARLSNWNVVTTGDDAFTFEPSPQTRRIEFRRPDGVQGGQ